MIFNGTTSSGFYKKYEAFLAMLYRKSAEKRMQMPTIWANIITLLMRAWNDATLAMYVFVYQR